MIAALILPRCRGANMAKTNRRGEAIQKLVLAAVMTALVVILQFMGAFIRFGPFSISLVLIPIVICAAVCGKWLGAWLGYVFGLVVLISGDATAFLAIDVFGTVVTVLLKGTAAGFLAGIVYELFEKKNRYLAVVLSAITCPIVNTGVFLSGCAVFFLDTVKAWGVAEGYSSVVAYAFLVLVGGNFVFELISNIVLSPTVVRLLDIRLGKRNGKEKNKIDISEYQNNNH